MKKYFLIFVTIFFTNISVGWCEYFDADTLESVIMSTFPENLQSTVMAEYESQMDPDTGEIDEQGFYNVCYAGGYDVADPSGAEECAAFAEKLQDNKPRYCCEYPDAKKACVDSGNVSLSNGCNYAITTNDRNTYMNPQNNTEKLHKCILDKTIDWAIKYEGGFQQSKGDPGSRICDKKGKPLYNADGSIQLGATKFGVTTCYTGLSVKCVCGMNKDQAKQFYWHVAREYNYFSLPDELVAAVIQFSLAGVGRLGQDLSRALGKCSGPKINDCYIKAINEKYYRNGTLLIQQFYNDISTAHKEIGNYDKNLAKAKKNKSKNKIHMWEKYIERADGVAIHLPKVYNSCLTKLGMTNNNQ